MDNKIHVLDLALIDAYHDIDGDDVCALLWCHSCQRYEWHYIPRGRGQTGEILRRGKAMLR